MGNTLPAMPAKLTRLASFRCNPSAIGRRARRLGFRVYGDRPPSQNWSRNWSYQTQVGCAWGGVGSPRWYAGRAGGAGVGASSSLGGCFLFSFLWVFCRAAMAPTGLVRGLRGLSVGLYYTLVSSVMYVYI